VTSALADGNAPQEHGGDLRQARRRFGREHFLDFSASINPCGAPPGLREELLARWDNLLHYPEPRSRTLVDTLAARFQLTPGQLLVGNGSAEIIDLVLRCRPWQRLLLSPPDFGLYGALAPTGTTVELVPRQGGAGFAPDLEGLAARARRGDLIILSNPCNPAGCAVDRASMLTLAGRCAEAGAVLALDEAFADFCPDVSVLGGVGRVPGLLVLRSLTKFYAIPGLRAGYLAGGEDLVGAAGRLQVPWSVNALAQAAGVFSLAQRGWEGRSIRYVEAERERLRKALAQLPGVAPHESRVNYLLVRLDPPAPPARVLYEDLAKRGLLIRHCGSFGLGEGYVRIAVRTRDENELLVKAFGELMAHGDSTFPEPSRQQALGSG
jgi:threonine-phosphate decarboxylase